MLGWPCSNATGGSAACQHAAQNGAPACQQQPHGTRSPTSSSSAMSRALSRTPCRLEAEPKSHSTQPPCGPSSTFSALRSLVTARVGRPQM